MLATKQFDFSTNTILNILSSKGVLVLLE